MEKITARCMRLFYVVMMGMLLCQIINTLVLSSAFIARYQALEMAIGIGAGLNLFLYTICFIYSARHKYVQIKTLLYVLCVSMFIMVIPVIIHNILTCPAPRWFSTLTDIFELALIEGIMFYRIKTIKLGQKVYRTEGERRWRA